MMMMMILMMIMMIIMTIASAIVTSGFGANMLNAVLDNEWMNSLLQMAACRFHLNFLGG